MPRLSTRTTALAGGLALGIAFTLTPLTVLTLVPFAWLLRRVSVRLPEDERWWFVRLFAVAMAVRLAAIVVLFLVSPHNTQGAGFLFGDEAYALTRSWRMRNLILGIPQLKYDYTVAFEEYGRSNFVALMTWLQLVCGPSPYGLRVVNAALFLSAVMLMFRMVRPVFGAATAFVGAAVLLFLPTLFFWSISLLKEPFYFVLTVGVLVSFVELTGAASWRRRFVSAAVLAAALFVLRDLRTGAVLLAASGLALGVLMAYLVARRVRAVVAAVALAAACVAVVWVPTLQQRAVRAIDGAADASAGHVFTVGHSYKLLDEGYYVQPLAMRAFHLPPVDAGRYVVRAAVSYLFTPLPWEIDTRGELAYLPEQLFWYVLLVLAPFGVVVGVKRSRSITWLLAAYVLPTAMVVAMTTGNVGTLIRHRTLIVPYLVWISALGFVGALGAVAEHGKEARWLA